MAQNISLWGASYSDVPAVNLPKTGGGTARFDDTSDADATASDILSGKTAYVNGEKITGTGSGGGSVTQDQDGFIVLPPDGGGGGGGGGSFEYETGVWTPTGSDTTRGTVNFQNAHTTAPTVILMFDTADPTSSIMNNTSIYWLYIDVFKTFGSGFPYSSSETRYSNVINGYRTSTGISNGGYQTVYDSDNAGDSSTDYPKYFATNTYFNPTSVGTRWFRTGRQFSWVALWLTVE